MQKAVHCDFAFNQWCDERETKRFGFRDKIDTRTSETRRKTRSMSRNEEEDDKDIEVRRWITNGEEVVYLTQDYVTYGSNVLHYRGITSTSEIGPDGLVFLTCPGSATRTAATGTAAAASRRSQS